jgi:2-phosphosulfolactate phosphatase
MPVNSSGQSRITPIPMKPTLNVYGLPRYVAPEELAGTTTVVIDVLRMATTIAYALDAGAKEIIPCLEVEDALRLAEPFSPDEVVLGGEREGVAIDGFLLGNSPEEYSPDRVEGKTVILTTTNGTRAMDHARQADEVFVAAFVDAAAVVAKLVDRERVSILCAGTDGHISEDDVLLAGLLVDRIDRQGGMVYQQNAQAITARELWLNSFALPQALGAEPLGPDRLADQLRKSFGARNLIALGLDDDILAAAQMDRFDVAPRLDTKTFRIAAADKRR